jgi:hypothetical protein
VKRGRNIPVPLDAEPDDVDWGAERSVSSVPVMSRGLRSDGLSRSGGRRRLRRRR